MARIRTLTPDEITDPELKAWMIRSGGDDVFGVYGHCPDILKTFLAFLRNIKHGGQLPFALKELVRLHIAQWNECHR